MKKDFTVSPLKRVIEPVERPEQPIPGKEYRQVGVQLWGRGAYEREPLDGGRTRYKTLSQVEKDDIIVNKIWARNGSVAVVPPSLAGCFASNEFPTFRPNSDQLVPRWFHWLTKTNSFWQQCDEKSRGTSGKNRIRPEKFLEILIPLPSLPEQRRIVARIEELSAKIEEARNLRQNSTEETETLMASEEMKIWPDEVLKTASTLGQVTKYLSRGRQSKQGPSDHLLIKTQHVQMGRYVPTEIRLDPYVASKVRDEALVRGGDILIACSAAGCLGRVAFYSETTDRVISTDTHVAIARPEQKLVFPEYLYAYLKGAQGQIQLRSREKGDWTREKIGFRLTELNVADMRRVPVPVPLFKEQRRIVAYLDSLRARVDALKKLQEESEAELNALMPSILSRAFAGEL